MFPFAQTNLQLYRQLEKAGYSCADRERVAQGYRFSMRLFSGLYRGSEKPFITHLVGTASILAAHQAPIDLVLAGLLHAAYMMGDFGYETGARQTRRKTECIKELVGENAENIISMYDDLPWDAGAIEAYLLENETLLPLYRSVITLRMANTLEDLLDGGILYCGGDKLHAASSIETQKNMAQLAVNIAMPDLAAQLKKGFQQLNKGSAMIVDKTGAGQSVLLLPLSAQRSPWSIVSGWLMRRLRRLNASPYFGRSTLVKNVFDRIFSALVLLVISPVCSLIALGIKLESPGPILFKQRRHGLGNIEIEVLKFRTMKQGSCNGEAKQAIRGDLRITRFGRILRKTSMDELPQFINVLRGDMSVVGPRPHPITLNESFMTQIDEYMERHEVKPGITGWAQVHGLRGETNTLEKMKKRVEYDFFYIRHRSLWLDIKIILRTAISGWTDKNAH